MVFYTALAKVEESRAAGDKVNFPPSLARIVSFVAPNDFPKKFLYRACPFVEDTGWPCHKSLEFGTKCGHKLAGIPRFRFSIRVTDAFHASALKPLSAQIWDVGELLLDSTPEDFDALPDFEQLLYVFELIQICPVVRISLSTKDHFVIVQHMAFVDGRPKIRRSLCPQPGTPSSSTCSPQSTPRKSGRSKEKALLAAMDTLVRNLDLCDDEE